VILIRGALVWRDRAGHVPHANVMGRIPQMLHSGYVWGEELAPPQLRRVSILRVIRISK
jgi:hypothetical protein